MIESALLALLLLPSVPDQPPLRTELFNASDLSGWSGDPTRWTVEDGLLWGRIGPDGSSDTQSWLVHDLEVRDFELSLGFRAVSGAGEIRVRSRVADEQAEAGHPFRLDAGGVANSEQWHTLRIVARGDHLLQAIDGRIVAEQRVESVAGDGNRIALGLDTAGGAEVAFRDLRLRQIEPEAEWIWSTPEALDDQQVTLRRTVHLGGPVRSARWLVTCDNRFTARLNGTEVGSAEVWEHVYVYPVEELLRPGDNLLEVDCGNEGGPAGMCGRLEVELESGATQVVFSGPDWSFDQDGERRPAHSFGPDSAPDGPWPAGLFKTREATAAEAIGVPAGFEIELIHSADFGEGSWISMAFDPQGRLVVGRQQGGLVRLTLGEDRVEREVLDLFEGQPQGLLFAHDGLYIDVTSTEDGVGGLYHWRDTDGDDRIDQAERLVSYEGVGEHGAHAMAIGPDSMLYMVHGNMVDLPAELAENSPHQDYAEDLLLDREWDPNGHAVGIFSPGARVLRRDADGRIELFAAGMRNPYDIAFHPDGELFTFDSDMEWDLGLPWYRPTRINHVVSAGDYGWRSGSGKWPEHYPDSLPGAVDIGRSSPTGLAFGHASSFPEPWRSALFAGDWSEGRILAVHLEPDGASYRGSFDEFCRGEPLSVTDLVFGPHGALWFITGGRGGQSGLYRVVRSDGGQAVSGWPAPAEPSVAIATRRQLERFHGDPDPAAVDAAWPHLGCEDRFLRYAARVALERQEPADWVERALDEKDPQASLTALLAAARMRAAPTGSIVNALLRRSYSRLSPAHRLEELRVVSLCLIRQGKPPEHVRQELLSRYDRTFPSGDPVLDRELFGLQLELAAPGIGDLGLTQSARAVDSKERFFYAFSLRLFVDEFSAGQREEYVRTLREVEEVGGGVSFTGFLDRPRELLTADERRRSRPERDDPVKDDLLSDESHAWTMAELLPQLAQLDTKPGERSFASGRVLFDAVQCGRCHRFDGRGGNGVAPDLTSSAGHMGRRELLEAILEPSRVISDQYRDSVLFRSDGSAVTGRILSEEGRYIEIRRNAVTGSREKIDRRDVIRRSVSRVSPMPPALLDRLKLEQILDLVAYIESRGKRDHSHYR